MFVQFADLVYALHCKLIIFSLSLTLNELNLSSIAIYIKKYFSFKGVNLLLVKAEEWGRKLHFDCEKKHFAFALSF